MIIGNLFPSFCELPDACRDVRLVRPPSIIMYICLPFALSGRTSRASLHADMASGDGLNLYFVVEK